MSSSPPLEEVELTDDRIDYARRVAIKEAQKHCGPRVSYDDVAQDALLHLISRPPRFDPSRGAKPETLIYTVIQRAVIKYAAREAVNTQRLQSLATRPGDSPNAIDAPTEEQLQKHQRLTGAVPTKHEAVDTAVDELLRFIDNPDSRAMCRLFIACDGNMSEVARRLNVVEGTIRHRLKMLGPKLRAAGFDPFDDGGVN